MSMTAAIKDVWDFLNFEAARAEKDLPKVRQRQEQFSEFAPGIGDILSAKEAITGRASTGEEVGPIGRVLSGVGALPIVPNIAGVFAGASAKTAKNITRWFKNPYDEKMRFEISDKPAKLIKDRLGAESMSFSKLDEYVDHPELFEAYPQLRNTAVMVQPEMGNTLASYDEATGLINLNSDFVKGASADKVKSILMHEIQHAIQGIEGFAKGGNRKSLEFAKMGVELNLKEIKNSVKNIRETLKSGGDEFVITAPKSSTSLSNEVKIIKGKENLKAEVDNLKDIYNQSQKLYKQLGGNPYKRLAGEIESRVVQKRAMGEYGLEEMKKYPPGEAIVLK